MEMNWIVRNKEGQSYLRVRVRLTGTEPKDLWPGPEDKEFLHPAFQRGSSTL